MQYLKDSVKQKIIDSALVEFRKNGYNGASMRDIAANTDIVSGNIYRYFRNKEDLFACAVGPAYEKLEMASESLRRAFIGPDVDLSSGENQLKIDMLSVEILDLFSQHKDEILILLEKSEGTRFEGTKEKLKQTVSAIMRVVYLSKLGQGGRRLDDEFLIYLVASSFVDGVCLTLESSEEAGTIKNRMDVWIQITFHDLHKWI